MWAGTDPVKLRASEWKQICTKWRVESHKVMKGGRLTAKDKILIVLKFLETDTKTADLCRKYSIDPSAFSRWRNVNI